MSERGNAQVRRKVLLVDDDQDLVAEEKQVLEANGYEVYTAGDGASGIETARRVRPDLMVLDVMMATDEEGFEVSREIRKIPELKSLPVILVTGIRKKKDLPFGFEPDDDWLPVKAVLEKPVKPEDLLRHVEGALAR